jgi:hypothetical protein
MRRSKGHGGRTVFAPSEVATGEVHSREQARTEGKAVLMTITQDCDGRKNPA